eukprot:scaffold2639_cov361-Pavlova_lutheri.AAC.70
MSCVLWRQKPPARARKRCLENTIAKAFSFLLFVASSKGQSVYRNKRRERGACPIVKVVSRCVGKHVGMTR